MSARNTVERDEGIIPMDAFRNGVHTTTDQIFDGIMPVVEQTLANQATVVAGAAATSIRAATERYAPGYTAHAECVGAALVAGAGTEQAREQIAGCTHRVGEVARGATHTSADTSIDLGQRCIAII